ncbi:hypothetical protein PI126_g24255, partial [Phytophthora idaei]
MEIVPRGLCLLPGHIQLHLSGLGFFGTLSLQLHSQPRNEMKYHACALTAEENRLARG